MRDLLAATGVIEPYSAGLETLPRWLADFRAGSPAEYATLIERFARWKLLCRLRQHP